MSMITCVVRYVVDPDKIDDFERFAQRWMELDDGHALFSFPSLAEYEQYRSRFGSDPDFVAADRIVTRAAACSATSAPFMRPLLPGAA